MITRSQNEVEEPDEPSVAALVPSSSARATPGELRELREELAELDRFVADEETSLALLRTEIAAFEKRYKSAIGPRHRELERLEAEIAEAFAALDPDDPVLAELARDARRRADADVAAPGDEELALESGCGTPSIGLKRLYRQVAFEMHPDRCADASEASYRTELMAEANRAYREGDLETLEALLAEFEAGDASRIASLEMRSLLSRLARGRRRILALGRERESIESSEIFALYESHARAAEEGRDLFKESLDSLDRRISRTRARLEILLAAG